jgi:hypothetical protein
MVLLPLVSVACTSTHLFTIWLLSGAVCCFDEAVLVYGGVASGIELKVNRITFLVDRAYLKLKNARMIMHLESLRG